LAKKLFIKTFGCQMNEYDSEKMADVLRESHGYELTETVGEADLLLVNTCSIREKAQEKVFSELGRWRSIKEGRDDVMIGVGGCVASQEGDGITKRAPFVDLVFGPQTLHRLPQMIDDARRRHDSVVDISFPEIEKFDRLPEPRADGPTAFVSCMEGCSKYCSFCVVPYTRGEEISRPLDDVIAEVFKLADQGVREVNLLGQNVNAYRGPMHDGSIADLATLIYYVAAIDGIDRIRFTTSHPVEFTDSLVQAYAEVPKLANYLHLPVQHGSDRILSLMKRGHTKLEYKQKIRKLREVRPDISLSSDFIVGFPGETDRDFEATMKLIADIGFDQSFSFIYSARPGTPAASARAPARRRRACPTTRRSRSRSNACRFCRRVSTSRPTTSARRWSAQRNACSSRKPRKRAAGRSRAVPRIIAGSTLTPMGLSSVSSSTLSSPKRCQIPCADARSLARSLPDPMHDPHTSQSSHFAVVCRKPLTEV